MKIEYKAAIMGALIAGVFTLLSIYFQSDTKHTSIENNNISNSKIEINQ